ncbi:MAG: hypothetical protein ACI8QZ_001945, partial [Chlamydiales bacterium]
CIYPHMGVLQSQLALKELLTGVDADPKPGRKKRAGPP